MANMPRHPTLSKKTRNPAATAAPASTFNLLSLTFQSLTASLVQIKCFCTTPGDALLLEKISLHIEFSS